jgi:Carboxypeptidase regulatory-like domain
MRLLLTLALLAIPAVAFGQSAGEIRGIVWTAEGKPLAAAQVFIHKTGEASHLTTTSGADGTFNARDLSPGHYWVAAYSEKAQLMSESSVTLDLAAGQSQHADVTLGKSTVTYPYFKRMIRRLDGLH